jgi:hypothetical protein
MSASGSFIEHVGFREEMAADGFVSLSRHDAGMNVVWSCAVACRAYAPTSTRAASSLASSSTTSKGELAPLLRDGAAVTMPLTEEEWGEHALRVRDPNGVIVQLVDWNPSPGADPVRDGRCRGVSSTAAAVPWNESSPGRQSAGVPKRAAHRAGVV